MVNKETEVLLKDKVTYDYSTLSVKGSEGEIVKVTIGFFLVKSDIWVRTIVE